MSTIAQLRQLAKDSGLKGYSKANKAGLIEMLEAHGNKGETATAEQRVYDNKDAVHAVIEIVKEKSEASPKKGRASPKRSEKTESVKKAPEAVSEQGKKLRTVSAWNEFLAYYKGEHGCTLKEAMMQKDEYAAWKAKRAPAA